jgi:Domain of unknown function (DUF4397)
MVSRLQKFGAGFLGLVFMFSTFSCGGGSGSATSLRVLAASPDETAVNVLVDGATVGSSLAYGANSGYQSVHSGNRQFAVEAVGTTTNLLPGNATLSLGSGTETTVIMAGFSSSLQGLVLADDNTEPSSNTINVRIVNVSPNLGPFDVYVVAPGTALGSATPVATNLQFTQASAYINLPIGSNSNYEIYFTEPGVPTFPYLDSGAISFASGQNRTIVGLNSAAGNSYTYLMLKDLN